MGRCRIPQMARRSSRAHGLFYWISTV
jgi:hypothetical protein